MQATTRTSWQLRQIYDQDKIGMYNENNYLDDQVNNMNISSASTATDNMEMSRRSNHNDYSIISIKKKNR